MRLSAPGYGGFAVTIVLGWLAAALSLVLALSLSGGRSQRSTAPGESPESQELRTLRLALSTATTENAALRTELDRLLTKRPAARATSPGGEGGASGQQSAGPEASELAGRIRDAITRAASVGDDESKRQAAMSLMQAFQQGPEGFPALRDAYLATEDPKAKTMLLPTLMFVGGEEARDLVLDQVHSVADPELRNALTILSVRYATPEHAPALKDVYLRELGSEDARLRTASIRGLRYAKGKDVQEALLSAAADPSEDIRLAAIEGLASRPALHEELRGLIERDASPRVREIGHCQMLVTQPAR